MTPDPEIRFLRFEYDDYYPSGGLSDLTGEFSTLEDAKSEPMRPEHGEIIDTWTGQVWNFNSRTGWYEP